MGDTSSTRAISRSCLPSQDPDLHRFLRHQREALRLGVPHAGMGNFQSATPGQFCIGGNTIEESFSRTANRDVDEPIFMGEHSENLA